MNRKFDKMGRIVLPKEMRDKLGFEVDSEATITLEDDAIVIRNASKVEYKERVKNALEYIQGAYEMATHTKNISLGKEEIEDLTDILEGKEW